MKKLGTKAFAVVAAAVIMITGVALSAGSPAEVANAAESFTVEAKNAVLYSNDKTKVYEKPDLNSTVVTTIAKDLPVSVTGITSNGWFRISLNGTYYVPGYGLESRENIASTGGGAAISSTDIKKLTKGTFSFYKSSELSKFDADDVEDMDENTYIKYLDSYLMGYALIDNCILQDSGETLKTVYARESKTDAAVASMTTLTYLINYRNNYFSDSMAGPFRSEKDLKLALNRAIRYDIETFGCVYRNASIGTSESKMKTFMENIISEMKAEQGVSFTCKMEYGTYKDEDGSEAKGWVIEFTKKK